MVRQARERTETHRGVKLKLPGALELEECTACEEAFVDNDEGDAYVALIMVAYKAEMRRRAIASLAVLEAVTTQRELEQLLHLSHGYLSKVHNGAKTPSGALVAQLALLALNPKENMAALERYWSAPATTSAA